MANLVNLELVSKTYGVRALLDEVSLGVHQGDRIGVVGLNGGGKTTLLEVLAGITEPDSGRVSHARDVRMAVVTQRTELDPTSTVRQAVIDPLGHESDHEWASDARVRSILDGLGITARGLDAVVGPMSGGERRRTALAAALVRDLDLIVLDEPTNHLDIEGIQWLAEHLLARRCALVVVTHDRWFLDTVCTRTWEVVSPNAGDTRRGGKVDQYEGGYADWIFARAERARLAGAAEEKRQNLARKELAWLRRGAPARTSKPRYRVEAAEALIADVPPPRDTVELVSFATRRLGRTVIELEDVSLTLGEKKLLDHVTWRLAPGERTGVVGVNGSGKTSLLRVLTGELAPDSGKRIQGKTVRLGHLSQELLNLPTELRVLEAVEEIARRVTLGKHEMSASMLLERLGFPAARQWTPVGDLSGGERRRLQLTRILMDEPNVLVLDEPTNDLDIDTLQQLEDLLDNWGGSLVVVSHDRYLLERACDKVLALFGDGRITPLLGGVDDYLRRRAESIDTEPKPTTKSAPTPTKLSNAEERAARKELSRLERKLATLTEKEEKLHAALAEAATDPDKLISLGTELKRIQAEKDTVEEQWLHAAEALEA